MRFSAGDCFFDVVRAGLPESPGGGFLWRQAVRDSGTSGQLLHSGSGISPLNLASAIRLQLVRIPGTTFPFTHLKSLFSIPPGCPFSGKPSLFSVPVRLYFMILCICAEQALLFRWCFLNVLYQKKINMILCFYKKLKINILNKLVFLVYEYGLVHVPYF